MKWTEALGIWNKGNPSWCIPRKGSKGYYEVKRIMDSNKVVKQKFQAPQPLTAKLNKPLPLPPKQKVVKQDYTIQKAPSIQKSTIPVKKVSNKKSLSTYSNSQEQMNSVIDSIWREGKSFGNKSYNSKEEEEEGKIDYLYYIENTYKKYHPEKYKYIRKYLDNYLETKNKQLPPKQKAIIQKPSIKKSTIPVKKVSNRDILINAWGDLDPYLGIILSQQNPKLYQELTNWLDKNKDKTSVIDTFILFLFKDYTDEIYEKYGGDILFEGLNIIMEYLQNDIPFRYYSSYFNDKDQQLSIKKGFMKERNRIKLIKEHTEKYNIKYGLMK
jgi:hypothetical protein